MLERLFGPIPRPRTGKPRGIGAIGVGEGTVYFVADRGLIKVGITKRLKGRLSQYGKDAILLAAVPGEPGLERLTHMVLRRDSITEDPNGPRSDYFHPTLKVMRVVAAARAGADTLIETLLREVQP